MNYKYCTTKEASHGFHKGERERERQGQIDRNGDKGR
jgi:hypothetical protein